MFNGLTQINIFDEINKLEGKTILAGIIGAIIVFVLRYLKYRYDRWLTKGLIKKDLHSKKEGLKHAIEGYNSVAEYIGSNDPGLLSTLALIELNPAIYNSIDKKDLLKIYGIAVIDIVNFYTQIEFIYSNKPSTIFTEYQSKWFEHKNSQDHQAHISSICNQHIRLSELATMQCKRNILTCEGLIKQADNILGFKYYDKFKLFFKKVKTEEF